jgi:Yip1 domain
MEKENINPWLGLWVQPRKTLRAILTTDPKKWIVWLAIIGGILSALSLAAFSWYPPKAVFLHPFLILILAIVGAIVGIVHLYFSSWLLTMTGSWLGGKGNFTEVKCAVGWSYYPFIIADILAIVSIYSTHNPWLKLVAGTLNVIAGVWGFVIFVKLVGEAHQFSAWKGLLSFLIALVLVFVAFMIVALLVPLLAPIFQ